MSDPRIRLVLDHPEPKPKAHRALGRLLVDAGHLSASDLIAAIGAQQQADAQIGHLLVSRGLVDEGTLYRTLADQHSAQFVSYDDSPPDLSLQSGLNPVEGLTTRTVPWRRIGNVTLIATADPAGFARAQAQLPTHLLPALMAVASASDIERAIRAAADATLTEYAEQNMPDSLSCRMVPGRLKTIGITTAACLCLALLFGWLSAEGLYASLFFFAITMVFVAMLLKTAGAALHLLAITPIFARKGKLPGKLPCVSLLVPINDEADILPHLLHRLGLLNYPKELLDIVLIIEETDDATRRHLEAQQLPHWMRCLVVPKREIQTKPRAMNYALPFCRGSIIGIYDAEDAPHPEQLRDVVATFAAQPETTACIQAVLDFYNARSNAMARFFAIEYAAWFRLILPGVARLGFAIPLGGTSVFFRRKPLEDLHGWDAFNVTEDADLGIRLVRAGYKTVLISSETLEEANNRVWPWIKQRSRWLKGYLITYLSHMRNPLRLLLELGLWKFIGFQAFFLSAISQYMLAPLIWSCMALYIGAPHFLQRALPPGHVDLIALAFVLTWIGSTVIYIIAVSGKDHRHLIPWTIGMGLYLSLGTLSIYKGAWEIITRPFFWDKTEHGVSAALQTSEAAASSLSRVTKATEI
ncbi:MAG: glycosyltransferase family 2 protein [Pseudomonadota bacterium]